MSFFLFCISLAQTDSNGTRNVVLSSLMVPGGNLHEAHGSIGSSAATSSLRLPGSLIATPESVPKSFMPEPPPLAQPLPVSPHTPAEAPEAVAQLGQVDDGDRHGIQAVLREGQRVLDSLNSGRTNVVEGPASSNAGSALEAAAKSSSSAVQRTMGHASGVSATAGSTAAGASAGQASWEQCDEHVDARRPLRSGLQAALEKELMAQFARRAKTIPNDLKLNESVSDLVHASVGAAVTAAMSKKQHEAHGHASSEPAMDAKQETVESSKDSKEVPLPPPPPPPPPVPPQSPQVRPALQQPRAGIVGAHACAPRLSPPLPFDVAAPPPKRRVTQAQMQHAVQPPKHRGEPPWKPPPPPPPVTAPVRPQQPQQPKAKHCKVEQARRPQPSQDPPPGPPAASPAQLLPRQPKAKRCKVEQSQTPSMPDQRVTQHAQAVKALKFPQDVAMPQMTPMTGFAARLRGLSSSGSASSSAAKPEQEDPEEEPKTDPSKPSTNLRRLVGLTKGQRRLEQEPPESSLHPATVGVKIELEVPGAEGGQTQRQQALLSDLNQYLPACPPWIIKFEGIEAPLKE